jgi:hypothetical protein
MLGDHPVEKREHDEVEHDRDDHFVRAELRFQNGWHRADQSPGCTRGDDAQWKREDEWRPARKSEPGQCSGKATGGELAFAANIEQPGAKPEGNGETGEGQCGGLVKNLTEAVRVTPRSFEKEAVNLER